MLKEFSVPPKNTAQKQENLKLYMDEQISSKCICKNDAAWYVNHLACTMLSPAKAIAFRRLGTCAHADAHPMLPRIRVGAETNPRYASHAIITTPS
jgi:hypothetical protein